MAAGREQRRQRRPETRRPAKQRRGQRPEQRQAGFVSSAACALLATLAIGGALLACSGAAACPFCVSIGETLSERREAAEIVAIVERAEGADGQPTWQVLRLIKGPAAKSEPAAKPIDATKPGDAANAGVQAPPVVPNATAVSAPAGLSLAFGARGGGSSLDWQITPVSEIAASYGMRAPDLRTPSGQRLRYFARYLEHPDALIAEDAFREFARAGFGEVAAVADALPMGQLRAWLADPATRPARKGFYGLALGLARDADERRVNREALRQMIVDDTRAAAPGADFRPGFDGVLGGYLLLAGEAGLDELAARYFTNPAAGEIDARQAIAALRFYHEHGRDIPLAAQCAALRLALRRPPLADQAITDLARWNDWSALQAIDSLGREAAYAEPRIRRAIAGYLLSCPDPAAPAMVARLRAQDPRAVEAAERSLGRATSGATPAEPQ
jgi:hypothetical protein